MMSTRNHWPPYELVDRASIEAAAEKTRRLERLYHLTQEHAWDGKAVLRALVDRHGPPGAHLSPEVRESLAAVTSVLLWGELAAWNISADLALAIEDVDAKMAATGQVFDEARHFYVLRDYVMMLGPSPKLGGIPKKLLCDVLDAPTLAKKLVGMQLMFETNAVVIFRRLADSKVCPVLSELLPYFERDESRHVGLGVLYLPRLIERMTRAEAVSTAAFQARCIGMLIAGGFVLRDHFARLDLDQRAMAMRVTTMQDDIVRQMAEAHGNGVTRAVLNPKASPIGPRILDFIHPPEGIDAASPWRKTLHRGLRSAAERLDRALA
jgi:hypothetical protein